MSSTIYKRIKIILCYSLTQEGHVMWEKYADIMIVGPTIFYGGFDSFTFITWPSRVSMLHNKILLMLVLKFSTMTTTLLLLSNVTTVIKYQLNQIPDIFPVLAAAHKTLVAKSRESLTTRTLHSELVYNYSGSKHVIMYCYLICYDSYFQLESLNFVCLVTIDYWIFEKMWHLWQHNLYTCCSIWCYSWWGETILQ